MREPFTRFREPTTPSKSPDQAGAEAEIGAEGVESLADAEFHGHGVDGGVIGAEDGLVVTVGGKVAGRFEADGEVVIEGVADADAVAEGRAAVIREKGDEIGEQPGVFPERAFGDEPGVPGIDPVLVDADVAARAPPPFPPWVWGMFEGGM